MDRECRPLPNHKSMKVFSDCHDGRSFIGQLLALTAVSSIALSIIFSIPLLLAAPAAVLSGTSFCDDDLNVIRAWSGSAFYCAAVCSLVLSFLLAFLRVYLRGSFGKPGHCTGFQVDLCRDSLLKLCQAYLERKCVDDLLAVDHSKGRLIAVLHEGRFSITYLEIDAYTLDENLTWMTLRSATRLKGYASLLSAFNIDFGLAQESAVRLITLIRPYASKRKAPSRISRSSMPMVQPVRTVLPPSLRQDLSEGISNQNVLPIPTSLVTPMTP